MVAPIDAKVTFEVEGEPITLRLNFRTLALAKKNGVNLMSGEDKDMLELATAVRCLAVVDHEKMTDDEALAIVMRGGEATANALVALFSDFAGSAGGNAKAATNAN